MPTVKVNDIQMYYERHGEGEPLVLICGLAIDLSENESIVRWLAKSYQVLAFDNRGAGRTDKPDMPYSIEMMAEDTAGLMQALGVKQARVIGTSMGGRIALALTLQHPELVKKLILVSTSARVIKSAGRTWRLRVGGLLSNLPLLRSNYPQPRYAFLRQLEASGSYNCLDRLPEIHAPTLILHGKQDKTVLYHLAEELHAGIAGSQMVMFKGGHIFFLFRERQPFLETIAQFLE
ncbi:MAG TPA: alpha/beta hydrolase [Ktedonobacterales bacterium]